MNFGNEGFWTFLNTSRSMEMGREKDGNEMEKHSQQF